METLDHFTEIDMNDKAEIIEHFSHPHRLILSKFGEYVFRHFTKCYCCGTTYRGDNSIYACNQCNIKASRPQSYETYYLCLPCSRLGEFVEHHVLHPQHPRIRIVNYRRNGNKTCAVCFDGIYRGEFLSYACDDERCDDFMMHIKCAHSLKPVVLAPRLHNHPLLMVTKYRWSSKLKCESCRCRIDNGSAFARCVLCNLNYHFNCERGHYELPQLIVESPQHPQHPLSLVESRREYFSCDVCGKERDWPGFPVYACMERRHFTAHISCIFQSLPCPFSRFIRSNFADMRIKDSSVHEDALCQGCKKRVLNGLPIYGCQYCNFFVHESCIQHYPIHVVGRRRNDPLALVFSHGGKFTCACCDRVCSGFMYKGENDVLHLQCMSSRLLPCNLLHECHFHPLTLVPSLVDIDEADGCYCDVCEGVRDPDECVYYCAECKFEAHTACVISEVLGPSCNKLKDFRFANLYEIEKEEKENKKKREVLYLDKELQHTCTLEKEIDAISQEVSKLSLESSIGRDKGPPNKILYSDDPFKEFIQKLNSTSTLEKARSSVKSLEHEKVDRVGEYLVPLDTENVLESLFDKYGDFGAQCNCSLDAKQYLFVGLCKALHGLCNAKFVRVTEDLLVEWWIWFAMGNAAGFKIQFAIEIWKRAMYAHFGLEADKYADGKLTRVRKKMKELPREIEEMTKKLEKIKRELEETETELEESIVEEKELRMAAFRVKKSDLMNKCLKEAEDLVCYSAGEILFPPLE